MERRNVRYSNWSTGEGEGLCKHKYKPAGTLSYTDYVDEDSSSWIHQIKKWMEKNNITITIKDMKHTKKNRIMQHIPQENKQK